MIDVRRIVETAFLAGWDSNTTPVKLFNVTGLVKGSTKIASQEKLAEYCELFINPGARQEADINDNHRIRSVGTISVNLYVKVGTGSARIQVLKEQIYSILQLKELADNFATRAGRELNVGQAEDESFVQVSIQIPYYCDDLQT